MSERVPQGVGEVLTQMVGDLDRVEDLDRVGDRVRENTEGVRVVEVH